MKTFGLSNTFMMLNRLLRYRYPDFPKLNGRSPGFAGVAVTV
jgi:hypothetical protein